VITEKSDSIEFDDKDLLLDEAAIMISEGRDFEEVMKHIEFRLQEATNGQQ
jgi:hypothetical protein